MMFAILYIILALFCPIVIYIILYGVRYITTAVPSLLNGARNDGLR